MAYNISVLQVGQPSKPIELTNELKCSCYFEFIFLLGEEKRCNITMEMVH